MAIFDVTKSFASDPRRATAVVDEHRGVAGEYIVRVEAVDDDPIPPRRLSRLERPRLCSATWTTSSVSSPMVI
jgi:hypothetical protein